MSVTRYGRGTRSGNEWEPTSEEAESRLDGQRYPRRVVGFDPNGQDVTRAELEQRLRDSEANLRSLTQVLMQGVLIVTEQHKPLLANQPCAS